MWSVREFRALTFLCDLIIIMFDTLGDKLASAFKKLKGQGVITEKTLNNAMREIRVALLEADVALEVSKSFIQLVKEKALGKEVLQSVDPGKWL